MKKQTKQPRLEKAITYKIVAKGDRLAVHSVGYWSRERAQAVVDSGEAGRYWEDKELAAQGFEVVEDN